MATSFMLGISEFIMVGILPQIAHGLHVSEVTIGNLVSLFAVARSGHPDRLGSIRTVPTFRHAYDSIAVFIGNILCPSHRTIRFC